MQASHNYSIQPHGVFFNKSNEGALYQDHTSGAEKADDIVQPGHIYTYRWTVPEHVGPTNADAQCVTWLYYSSVDPVKDTYSGESRVLSYSLRENKQSVAESNSYTKRYFPALACGCMFSRRLGVVGSFRIYDAQ